MALKCADRFHQARSWPHLYDSPRYSGFDALIQSLWNAESSLSIYHIFRSVATTRRTGASLLSPEARGEDGVGANSVEVVWAEVFVDPRALVGILGMSGVG